LKPENEGIAKPFKNAQSKRHEERGNPVANKIATGEACEKRNPLSAAFLGTREEKPPISPLGTIQQR
jgi:hypothetical protein